ncbi:hypothetical protein, partial [Lampropedia aestuarii]|uniref:hypothetical protein n=1 Tax=Lampropedia aestuarii TaxID=2562762 RepID=UPI002468B64A
AHLFKLAIAPCLGEEVELGGAAWCDHGCNLNHLGFRWVLRGSLLISIYVPHQTRTLSYLKLLD